MSRLSLLQIGDSHVKANASFYTLSHEGIEGKVCQGLACYVGRHLRPEVWKRAEEQKGEHGSKLYCLGKCYDGPATDADVSLPRMEVHSREPVILERIIKGGARTVAGYRKFGGYAALEKVRSRPAEETLAAVEASNLRGRGGAGFPTGRKWRAVAQQPTGLKYVVCNADEGDPAAFIDRFIIEDDPHCMIEAMAIAGHAVGATKGYVYLRKEYPAAIKALTAALKEAREAGILGAMFDLMLFEGHGSYICGEETALLNSIEGKRAEVRARPPRRRLGGEWNGMEWNGMEWNGMEWNGMEWNGMEWNGMEWNGMEYPTESGLWGRPTLVNNVETFSNIPWIVQHGAEAFRGLGFSKSQGTKVLSLNSLFMRPGLYEVEFGVSMRHIVEELGGGLKSGVLKGLIIGGPLAGVLPPWLLDTKFGFEELRAVGAMVGHGGILAFDEGTSIRGLVHHIAEFAARESCGKCTPCRRGGERVAQMFDSGKVGRVEFDEINAALLQTSLCGLGTGLAEFTTTAVKHYREELASCIN